MIRRSAFYFVVAIFLSCTEKETARDKYPSIPFFPESSSKKYVFKKTHFRGSVRLENFIVVYRHDRPTESVALYDLRTGGLKEVHIQGDIQYIDRFDGGIVTRINDSTFLRYNAPAFVSEIIPFRKYYKIVEDSTTKVRPLLDFRSLRTPRSEIFPCKTELANRLNWLIRDSTERIIVDSLAVDIDIPECEFVLDSQFPKNFLEPFDNVTLGYSFSGSNHIAFGIETNKLNYYRIVIGQDTLMFKNQNEFFELYHMPGQNPVIIDGYDSLYEVRLR